MPKPTAKYTPLPTPIRDVRSLEFSPDKKWFAVGSYRSMPVADGTITIRECATNRIVKSWVVSGGVKFLAFSPDGKTLASTGIEPDVCIWNWRSGRLVGRWPIHVQSGGDERKSLAFSPSGRLLAVGVENIQLFSTTRWTSRKLLNKSVPYSIFGGIRFAPGGRCLVASDDFEGDAGFTFVSLKTHRTRNIPKIIAYSAPVLSKDGHYLASSGLKLGEEGVSAFVYDVRSLKLRQTFHSKKFRPTDFSPDSRYVVGVNTDDSNNGGPVEIWSVATGKLVRQFKVTARRIAWVSRTTLLVGDENGVQHLRVGRLGR